MGYPIQQLVFQAGYVDVFFTPEQEPDIIIFLNSFVQKTIEQTFHL